MFRKVTDIVLYKEPKINITNFLKGPKVVLLLYVVNNIVLSIVPSGKQIWNSLRSGIWVQHARVFAACVEVLHTSISLLCLDFYRWKGLLPFLGMAVFSRVTSLVLVQIDIEKDKILPSKYSF